MGYWLKSYTDILDDMKYHKMSINGKLAMHEVFLIAKKIETDELTGLLPNLDEIAFHSRMDLDFWKPAMKELMDAGIVIKNDYGYLIKNYIKRQEAIPDNVRMKQYRKRKNESLIDGNGDVTNRNGDKIREDKIREDNNNFFSKFQTISQMLFGNTKETEYLKNLLEDYNEDTILEIAGWWREKNPKSKSMMACLRTIDTSAPNWNSKQKDDLTAVFESLKEEG